MNDSYKSADRRSCVRLTPYIYTEEARENLRTHKYFGSDAGISYVWFWNPVANKLVTYLPETVAPNTLTVLGFFHILLPLAMMFIFVGSDYYGPVPSWFCYLQAWCFFAYRMLDEMDGKQARRTKNGSALGLIFDHGCDAFGLGFGGLIVFKCICIGNNSFALICFASLMTSFHLATLEEYYIGTLALPVCNGVSDGSVLLISLFIVTGICGETIWTH